MISEGRVFCTTLLDSLSRLERYIQEENYAGYDPYDLLLSPLFSLPGLRSAQRVRFVSQQVFRRLPVNCRPLLRIRKGQNPVTYGLCIHAYALLASCDARRAQLYRNAAEECIEELIRLQSHGYHGACWGYDFPWSGRYAAIPAYVPTIVATGIITNGLFAAFRLLGLEKAGEILRQSAGFVATDLHRTYVGETLCFSYSPHDTQSVLNATAKAARLLAQVYAITGDGRLLEEAEKTIRFIVQHQRSDGGWGYSIGDARTWTDNFHTGYVLDCLHEYALLTGDQSCTATLDRGFRFYRASFITSECIPRYYQNRTFPIDATAAAQSILTLARFGALESASRVADWMIRNMQDPRGFFYYRRHRSFTNRISYMRWSNAWMYLSLARLLKEHHALV